MSGIAFATDIILGCDFRIAFGILITDGLYMICVMQVSITPKSCNGPDPSNGDEGSVFSEQSDIPGSVSRAAIAKSVATKTVTDTFSIVKCFP